VRRLIVNADDFGLTSGVNHAILEAHTRGVVTSATLMATGPAFAEAVQLAASASRLSIGCHVVLIDGAPVLPPEEVSRLTDEHSPVPRFRDGLKSFAARAMAGRIPSNQIEAEASAQIRRLQSSGIAVSHVDTHKHTHLFPIVLRPLMRAAAACGVRALRNPFGPGRPWRSNQLLKKPRFWMRYAQLRFLQRFANRFREAVEREGLITTDGTLGIEVTGALDETLFEAIAEDMPEGTWEFVCHPGYNDADLHAATTRLRESREIELRALTLPEVREVLHRNGIALISYHDLHDTK
jgi:hopanoid biosynthesis associated protein HpnK